MTTSPAAVAVVCGLIGLPVGWLAWRWAQVWIEGRKLGKGDTEVRLPALTSAVLTAVIFGALGWRFAADPFSVLAVNLVVFWFLVVLLLVDFARYVLPNQLIALAFGLGLAGIAITSVAVPDTWLLNAVYGAFITFGVYFVFWFVAMLAFGNRGLGFGDVKLAAVLGLLIGWISATVGITFTLVFWSVLIGFLSGSIVSLVLLRGVKLRSAFPMGPFLVLGTLVVLVSSEAILG